jgi:hypothetical protein
MIEIEKSRYLPTTIVMVMLTLQIVITWIKFCLNISDQENTPVFLITFIIWNLLIIYKGNIEFIRKYYIYQNDKTIIIERGFMKYEFQLNNNLIFEFKNGQNPIIDSKSINMHQKINEGIYALKDFFGIFYLNSVTIKNNGKKLCINGLTKSQIIVITSFCKERKILFNSK